MQESIGWHAEVLPKDVQGSLVTLSAHPAVQPFYLAGGTALALQSGHRTSVDLDFFTADLLNEDLLLGMLQSIHGISVVSKSPETLHLHIGSIKLSFIGYHYPVLFPFNIYNGIKVADPRDIAAMKLSAVASRGTKRDFIDLYVLSQKYGLDAVMRFFEQKFSRVEFSDIHLMKSLTYFSEADREPMPHMLQPITWDQVRQFFTANVPRLKT